MEIERGARFKCDEHHKFYLNPAKSELDGIEGCLRDIPGNTGARKMPLADKMARQ
jgi:hypothetical protein